MPTTEAQLNAWFDANWPRRNWSGLCQAVMVNAAQATGGLRRVYPNATAAMLDSGWRNPDASLAPAGAQHWYGIPDPDGHVALDLSGGGRRLLHGFTVYDERWGTNLGVISQKRLLAARPAWSYLGWTRNNGDNTITLSTTAAASVVVTPFDEPEEADMKWFLRDDGNQSVVGVYTFIDFTDPNRAEIVGRNQCDQDKPIKISKHEYAILREEHAKRVAELRGYLKA